MKIIIINTPTGQFELPLEVVARHRTEYYAGYDNFEEDSDQWKEEMDLVMNDTFEGVDWLTNNLDWVDVKDKATQINSEVHILQADFWRNSEGFKIIDK